MIRQDRYDRLLEGQSEIAKKVHALIPDDRTVTLKQVYSEVRKSLGAGREVNVIEGCVNTLTHAGLLRESPTGRFRRVIPRAVPVKDAPNEKPRLGDVLSDAGISKETFKPTQDIEMPAPTDKTNCLTIKDLVSRIRNLASYCGDDLGLVLLETAEGCQQLTSNTRIDALPLFDDFMARLVSKRVSVLVKTDTDTWDPRPVILPESVTVPKGIRIRNTEKASTCGIDLPGISQSAEYQRWTGFTNPSKLKFIAASGVDIDPRWLSSFRVFLDEVGYRPEFGASLQRVDESKGYYGWNFRWRKDGKTLPKCLIAPEGWPFMEYMDALAVVRMNQTID